MQMLCLNAEEKEKSGLYDTKGRVHTTSSLKQVMRN